MQRQVPATRGAYALTSDGWARHIIGKVSFLIDPDVEDENLRRKWENELVQQFTWAMHIGVFGIILPPAKLNCFNYARIINRFLAEGLNH